MNASEMPWIAQMRERAQLPPPATRPRPGERVYAELCASCHGLVREGRDRAPALRPPAARLSAEQLRLAIEWGRGFMPSFAGLPTAEKNAIVAYLLGLDEPPVDSAAHARELVALQSRPAAPRYEFTGYNRWRDSTGYPAIKPPWGTLSAIDLNTGEYRWRIPLGRHPALAADAADSGTEQYGGPIVTAGGVVFIAATLDSKIRAFDARTGQILWEAALPAPGFATPATYSVRGKQYVVIAAGGGKIGAKSHDAYVAFALP